MLNGATVLYGSASELSVTLEYDFSEEKKFSYKSLSMDEIIHHLALFISRLWQIHIFEEGNTRATAVFLIKFENLLLGYHNELKNRYLHVNYVSNKEDVIQSTVKSANTTVSKCKNCTLEESAILQAIAENPLVTQKELAGMIGKSERTVKTRTVELQAKGYLRRENGKRNGRWEVLIPLSDENSNIN